MSSLNPNLRSQARIPLAIVDAFTSEPFRGNPAAVCLLEAPGGDGHPHRAQAAEEGWMQKVATEMNHSETAFLVPAGEGWNLRWFTPVVEVALCGHATLASAHFLWETGRLAADAPALFDTRKSGRLTCRREGDWIAMDFPARDAEPCAAPRGLAEALGCAPVWVGRSAYDYLVHVADGGIVRALNPDLAAVARLPVRGVIVTAAGDVPGFDFISRFFAPGGGVPEDPVTGSAHCTLAPYWARELGRVELRAWQASRRGGEVRLRVRGDRVDLCGQAVTVARGELFA